MELKVWTHQIEFLIAIPTRLLYLLLFFVPSSIHFWCMRFFFFVILISNIFSDIWLFNRRDLQTYSTHCDFFLKFCGYISKFNTVQCTTAQHMPLFFDIGISYPVHKLSEKFITYPPRSFVSEMLLLYFNGTILMVNGSLV